MAKGKSRRSEPAEATGWRSRVHFVGFSYDEEREISEWVSHYKPSWTDCFTELLEGSWAVKVSPADDSDDYWASITSKRKGERYSGHTFTIRYPDYEWAIVLAYFVAFRMVLEGRMDLVTVSKSRAWLSELP